MNIDTIIKKILCSLVLCLNILQSPGSNAQNDGKILCMNLNDLIFEDESRAMVGNDTQTPVPDILFHQA